MIHEGPKHLPYKYNNLKDHIEEEISYSIIKLVEQVQLSNNSKII